MSDSPLISVRGVAELEVEPEIAQITVRLEARDSDRSRTLERLTERNKSCLELIRSYGDAVEKLETSGFSVAPLFRDRRRDEKVHRYQGSVRVTATVCDFTALGEMVTRLAAQELTSVAGPWWSLRSDSKVHRKARQRAAREAVTRAREYAEALGCALTGLVSLSDVGLTPHAPDYPMPVAAGLAYGSAQPAEPPPLDLEPRTQTVRAEVEARFTTTAPDDL